MDKMLKFFKVMGKVLLSDELSCMQTGLAFTTVAPYEVGCRFFIEGIISPESVPIHHKHDGI